MGKKTGRVTMLPLTATFRTLIKRYAIGDIVSANVPVFIHSDYWHDQIMKLPNPPHPISNRGEGHEEVPGRLLWWDGDNDIALVQYTAYSGTGHTGIYDSMDAEPFFDASRRVMDDGCVFIPTAAINFKKSGVPEPDVAVAYLAERRWHTSPMICNLAQYRVSARVMGETLGVSRQAIHLALAKLPETITEMTAVLNRPDVLVGECQHSGCAMPARSPRSKYCAGHWEDEKADTIGAYNAQNPAPRPFKTRTRKRYALPRVEAEATVDDFLPLVDQTEES